jgi:hypothetical protein
VVHAEDDELAGRIAVRRSVRVDILESKQENEISFTKNTIGVNVAQCYLSIPGLVPIKNLLDKNRFRSPLLSSSLLIF